MAATHFISQSSIFFVSSCLLRRKNTRTFFPERNESGCCVRKRLVLFCLRLRAKRFESSTKGRAGIGPRVAFSHRLQSVSFGAWIDS